MATTWIPRHSFAQRQTWLLANGEIIPEPDLEESASGVKVRLAGTAKSVYKREVDTLVQEGLRRVAQAKRTSVWMPIDLGEKVLKTHAGFDPANTPASFKMDNAAGTKARAWWSFKHPTLPIRALLYVHLSRRSAANTTLDVFGRLAMPRTTPNETRHPQVAVEVRPNFENLKDALGSSDEAAFEALMQANPPEWALGILEYQMNLLEGAAVKKVLEMVRRAEQLETITVPDLRNPAEPDWLELHLEDTNVNGLFLEDLREYVEGAPAVERIAEVYREFVQAMRDVGLVLPGLNDNQFHRALTSGDEQALTVQLARPYTGEEADNKHFVSMHLPTGTFVVTCSVKERKEDEIAHAWEESRLLASLTGQEDELLAYARRYVETEHERRAKKTVKQRKNDLTNN